MSGALISFVADSAGPAHEEREARRRCVGEQSRGYRGQRHSGK